MPLQAFIDPTNGQVVSVEAAEDYFDQQGLAPRFWIRRLKESLTQDRRMGPYLSPSICDPTSTCRRSLLLKQFEPFTINPISDGAASLEGTLIHAGMFNSDEGCEVQFPRDEDEGKPGVRRVEQGFLVLEIWPGFEVSTRVDMIYKSEILDLKTQRYSKAEQPPKIGWNYQLGMIDLIRTKLTGEKGETFTVWRFLQGTYEDARRWRKIPITIPSEEELRTLLYDWGLQFVAWWKERNALEGEPPHMIEAWWKKIPLEGQNMWGGKDKFGNYKRCGYCDVKNICFEKAGIPTF